MNSRFFLFVIFCCFVLISFKNVASANADVRVTNLICEYKTNPLGIDVVKPRLGWQLQSSERNVMQQAYAIQVALTEENLESGNNLLWKTGQVKSDQSVQVEYQGEPLRSGQRVYWRVKVWTENGESEWSEPSFWEMGLLEAKAWKAEWIEPDLVEDYSVSNPCPMLRTTFSLENDIKKARAYVTAHGLYEMHLNGKRVGEQVFTPGWTAYQEHIQYQTYDVTSLLQSGDNAVGVFLGDGWYRGNLGFQTQRNTYGRKLALLAQITVEYENGDIETFGTDDTWTCSTGPILASDIYNGANYDARLEKQGWTTASFDDSDWKGVNIQSFPKDNLIAPAGPPILKIEKIKPIDILVTPEGDTVVDIGQNMVGWIRMQVEGERGRTITLRHAEVLDREGNFYTENLRAADQTNSYTLKGTGKEVYEPRFTFQGFRYVAVDNYPGELTLDDLTGIVVHSDIEPTGTFECSNDMINQLQHNIKWGQKGNFLDVPTDCPQRDERLGWTGDAQVFARTACFNADVAGFYTKWLKDVSADQQARGEIPHVIPNCLSYKEDKGQSAAAGWADAALIVPWTVYLSYGDKRILEEQYDCMKGWVDYMAFRAGDSYFWNTDFTFGDWLAFSTDRSDYPGATTSKDLISQAYFARSTDLLIRTAKILDKKQDVEKYSELFENIKTVFINEFVTPNGRVASNTQTAYSLALAFDLLPDSLRKNAAQRLANDVNGFKHITTGFLGTPQICHVLGEYGYYDEAFMLLNRKEYPSWLYPITKNATTIWERWDGIKPDGTFQNPGMNSFNHYAYGAIGEWLYRVVAGIEIDPDQPGYKHIIIQPHPGGGLDYARAEHHSLYGKVVSGWTLNDGTFELKVTIPANTSATILLPDAETELVEESGKSLSEAKGILSHEQKGNKVLIKVGSGEYVFRYSQ